jgi:hypothetical protein
MMLLGSCGNFYLDQEDYGPMNRNLLPFPGAGRVDDIKLLGNDGETVYEDAEDGSVSRWWEPANILAEIKNVFDMDRQSRVIEFFDNDTGTTFVLGDGTGERMWDTEWNNTTQFTLQFSIRYRVDFEIAVLVFTSDNQKKWLIYTPIDYDRTYPADGYYAHHGLGSDAADGTWRTFTRDLAQDLKDQFPALDIGKVSFFKVWGKCAPPPVIVPSEDPFTIGFWKNNIYKLLNNQNGTQVESLDLLENYLSQINIFELSVFDVSDLPDLDTAYAVLSSNSPDAVSLLKKQLLAAELNFFNGAYFSSPGYTQQQLSIAENLILRYQAGDVTVTREDLIAMKDLLDSFNNGELLD